MENPQVTLVIYTNKGDDNYGYIHAWLWSIEK